jgi:hypothetical protein
MSDREILQELPAFSLVRGGPLFQLFRRTLLSGDDLELLHRRIIVIPVIAWLPLLILSSRDGHALSGVTLPFLHDVETHIRFLIALPLLIAAELVVHLWLSPAVLGFVNRGIVVDDERPTFYAAIVSATRLRNSISFELGLLVFVWSVGPWLWRSQMALGTSSWYSAPDGARLHLTLAGDWNAFVSIPIFQFILMRWYLRLLIWFRFLWQVSKLHLHLVSTHPDRAGGIAFLGKISYAFGPLLCAQGAMLAGLIANRVLYGGESLTSFRMEAIGLIGLWVLFILGPLTMFTPQLIRAKIKGSADYGRLASRYVLGFEGKWVQGNGSSSPDNLLGSADIQSLADIGNSYAVVTQMRPVPFGLKDIIRLAAATAAPLVPLGLTKFSFEELVLRLLRLVL